jgi:hypothetical protein
MGRHAALLPPRGPHRDRHRYRWSVRRPPSLVRSVVRSLLAVALPGTRDARPTELNGGTLHTGPKHVGSDLSGPRIAPDRATYEP